MCVPCVCVLHAAGLSGFGGLALVAVRIKQAIVFELGLSNRQRVV